MVVGDTQLLMSNDGLSGPLTAEHALLCSLPTGDPSVSFVSGSSNGDGSGGGSGSTSGGSTGIPSPGALSSAPMPGSNSNGLSAAAGSAAAAAVAASIPPSISFYLNGSPSVAFPPLFGATRLSNSAPTLPPSMNSANINGLGPVGMNGLNSVDLNRLGQMNDLGGLNVGPLASSLGGTIPVCVGGSLPHALGSLETCNSLPVSTANVVSSGNQAAVAAAAAAAAAVAGFRMMPSQMSMSNQMAAASAAAQAKLLRLRLAGSDEKFTAEMSEICEFVDRLKLDAGLNNDEKILNAAICILSSGTPFALLSPVDIVDDIYAGKRWN